MFSTPLTCLWPDCLSSEPRQEADLAYLPPVRLLGCNLLDNMILSSRFTSPNRLGMESGLCKLRSTASMGSVESMAARTVLSMESGTGS